MDDTPKDPFEQDTRHDKQAEEEAVRRMRAGGTGDSHDPDPAGGHDDAAAEEAARRMQAEAKPKK
jgi:hypothetical protein